MGPHLPLEAPKSPVVPPPHTRRGTTGPNQTADGAAGAEGVCTGLEQALWCVYRHRKGRGEGQNRLGTLRGLGVH